MGETVSTLNAKLRVKHGLVGVSGSATSENQILPKLQQRNCRCCLCHRRWRKPVAAGVYSDNGYTNGYDLGDSVSFPSLSTPYGGYATYQLYLRAHALILTNQLANVTPNSNFSYSDANGSISMSGGC